MSAAKGNSNWFYFWLNASPDLILNDMASYSGVTKADLVNKYATKDELRDYAEQIGLIRDNSDKDKMLPGSSASASTVQAVEWLLTKNCS